MATLIPPAGTQRSVKPDGDKFTDKELGTLVADGGAVDKIWINDQQMLVVDAQGKSKRKPFNMKATTLASHVIDDDGQVVGEALVVMRAEIEK